MKDSVIDLLVTNLTKIETIVEELPRIGKRSELKDRADSILRLTKMIRNQAYLIENEKEKEKSVPDLGQMFGGVVGRKKD